MLTTTTIEKLIESLNINLYCMYCEIHSSIRSLPVIEDLILDSERIFKYLKESLKIVEQIQPEAQEENEELTNGDILTLAHRDALYLYAFAEMPNGSKKWFKGKICEYDLNQATGWVSLEEDGVNNECLGKQSENIFRPSNCI
jgi:phage anti-repressor protein